MSYSLVSRAHATLSISVLVSAMLARLSPLGLIAGVSFGVASGFDVDVKCGLMRLAFLVTQLA